MFHNFEYSFFIAITITTIEQILWLNFELMTKIISSRKNFVRDNLTGKLIIIRVKNPTLENQKVRIWKFWDDLRWYLSRTERAYNRGIRNFMKDSCKHRSHCIFVTPSYSSFSEFSICKKPDLTNCICLKFYIQCVDCL